MLPSESKRSGIEQASVLCPEICESKEHRLLFLRCEQFNVDVSSSTLVVWCYVALLFIEYCDMVPTISKSALTTLNQLAAIRLAKYWKKRIELFHSDTFSPLTIAHMREKDSRGENYLSGSFVSCQIRMGQDGATYMLTRV